MAREEKVWKYIQASTHRSMLAVTRTGMPRT